MLGRCLAIVVLCAAAVACATTSSSSYETPRVAATGDNVDHYGRPTDPQARECYDRCMRQTDVTDAVFGTSSFKTDERQQSACWDHCAPRVKPKVCAEGEVQSCSCPNPGDFSAKPLPGVRVCLPDRTRFGGCDCTPKSTPAEEKGDAPEEKGDEGASAAVSPFGAEATTDEAACKSAIKSYCVELCADSTVAERGPCEIKCMKEPIESYDGKLKECTPELSGY